MVAATVVNSMRALSPGAKISEEDLLPLDVFVPNRTHAPAIVGKLESALPGLEAMEGLNEWQ